MVRSLSLFYVIGACFLVTVAHAASVFPPTRLTNTVPKTGSIEGAFNTDGYDIVKKEVYNSKVGYMAESKTATVLGTKQKKRIFYVEGSGFEMGYLLGRLAYDEATTMVTTYLENLPLELVGGALADKAANSKFWKGIYDALRDLINRILVGDAVVSFDKQAADFPKGQVDEMSGMAAGAASVNPNTAINTDRLKTLNYGIDLALAIIYTGKIRDVLITHLKTIDEQAFSEQYSGITHAEMLQVLSNEAEYPSEVLFRAPVSCHAYGVRGNVTKSGKDAYFGRDFMLPCGGVFQNVNSMIIYNPNDGRFPLVSAGAPGMIGSVTSMNIHGVSMGVDVVRSKLCNPDAPGLNSLMLVRAVGESASTLDEALDVITKAPRGVTWLYPVCDGSGACAVVEAAMTLNQTGPVSGLSVVTDRAVKDLLPSEEYVLAHQSNIDYRAGLYIRQMDYHCPILDSYVSYNKPLFDLMRVPYDGTQWGETGFVWGNWSTENGDLGKIMNNYFSPQRENDPNVVLCSNNAISPSMRISQMTTWTDGIMKADNTAPQWRYDQLWSLIQQSYGSIDYERARYIISLIAPDRAPGFPGGGAPLQPGNDMTKYIEGLISIVDLKNRVIETHGGYWADEWTKITLPNYVTPSRPVSK